MSEQPTTVTVRFTDVEILDGTWTPDGFTPDLPDGLTPGERSIMEWLVGVGIDEAGCACCTARVGYTIVDPDPPEHNGSMPWMWTTLATVFTGVNEARTTLLCEDCSAVLREVAGAG